MTKDVQRVRSSLFGASIAERLSKFVTPFFCRDYREI